MLCALAVIPVRGMAWLFPALVLLKYAADRCFLLPYMKFYGKPLSGLPMLAYEAIYPLYVMVAAGIAVAGKTTWKGRRYVRKASISYQARRET
jgi:hypothetical protein